MRDILNISIGAGAGAAAAVIAMAIAYMLPDAARKVWGEMLAWVAHPMAVMIASITRQRLQAEMSVAIHLVAIFVTFMMVGALFGWFISKTS